MNMNVFSRNIYFIRKSIVVEKTRVFKKVSTTRFCDLLLIYIKKKNT